MGKSTREVKRLLAANRSEIAIRVFRSAHELGVRTVAIYSHEDRYALHRFKADEAYPIGRPGEPLGAYLGIDEIIASAKLHEVEERHANVEFENYFAPWQTWFDVKIAPASRGGSVIYFRDVTDRKQDFDQRGK